MGAAIPRRTLTCARRVRRRVERCTIVGLRRTHVDSKFRTRPFTVWFASPHPWTSLTLQRALFCCDQHHEVKTRTSVIARDVSNARICPASRNRALEWFAKHEKPTLGRTMDLLEHRTVITVMGCVVPLCIPPVRAELFVWICAFAPTIIWTGHVIPWLQEKLHHTVTVTKNTDSA